MSVLSRAYEKRDGSEFQAYERFTVEFREASHSYWLHHDDERTRVVSVTSALRVLEKPALLPWAEAAGAEGAARLAELGELKDVPPEEAVNVVRLHKLGMDAKRDAGADRGTAVHRVLEFWARERSVPDVADFPAEHRGYVQALCSWLLQKRPKPTSVERFVGSLAHQYAGRIDLRADIDGEDTIVDLKTSPTGRVYPEAHLQTAAYSFADIECGSPPPHRILIVGVGADGSFTQVDCEASGRDWLNVLATYRSLQRLKANIKATAA